MGLPIGTWFADAGVGWGQGRGARESAAKMDLPSPYLLEVAASTGHSRDTVRNPPF